jgi:hypothetical protein
MESTLCLLNSKTTEFGYQLFVEMKCLFTNGNHINVTSHWGDSFHMTQKDILTDNWQKCEDKIEVSPQDDMWMFTEQVNMKTEFYFIHNCNKI